MDLFTWICVMLIIALVILFIVDLCVNSDHTSEDDEDDFRHGPW